jgi:hypothetical protein
VISNIGAAHHVTLAACLRHDPCSKLTVKRIFMLFTPLFGATAVLISLLLCFRFDARLMLTSLPPLPAPSLSNDPLAKIGWDDLDSDSEDTFFMSAAEIETFKADKTRREMEENRQKRMRALEEQEAAERDPNDPAGWGDSDEEVSHAFMRGSVSTNSLGRSL